MSLLDSLPRFLFPTRSRGSRWLREQLRSLGVTAPLSQSCLDELVASADAAIDPAGSAGETYAASLKNQLESRARFVHHWTTTDASLEGSEPGEWIAIARKHLLPRSWSIPQTRVSEARRDESLSVPSRLVIRRPRATDSARPLPGTEILSDLKRVGDKS